MGKNRVLGWKCSKAFFDKVLKPMQGFLENFNKKGREESLEIFCSIISEKIPNDSREVFFKNVCHFLKDL